jgi:VWFA-related protein
MKYRLLDLVTPALMLALFGAPSSSTILDPKGTASTVWIQATVVDAEGGYVQGLGNRDFMVQVGAARYPVTVVTQREPVAAVLMLDVSRSATQVLARVRSAVGILIESLSPGDRINIAAFDSLVRLSDRFTASPLRLAAILDPPTVLANVRCHPTTTSSQSRANVELPLSAGTAMWPAVQCAVRELVRDGEAIRRVLILVTDGHDNSRPGFEDAATNLIQRSGVLVYTIAVPAMGGAADARSDARLRQLAAVTGGRYFPAGERDDTATTFNGIVEELRAQYLLGFEPGTRSGVMAVSVGRPGAVVRARQRFVQ